MRTYMLSLLEMLTHSCLSDTADASVSLCMSSVYVYAYRLQSKIVVSSRTAARFARCNAGLQWECKDWQSLWALNSTVAYEASAQCQICGGWLPKRRLLQLCSVSHRHTSQNVLPALVPLSALDARLCIAPRIFTVHCAEVLPLLI